LKEIYKFNEKFFLSKERNRKLTIFIYSFKKLTIIDVSKGYFFNSIRIPELFAYSKVFCLAKSSGLFPPRG